MKIIISHKGVKRELDGTGFNICACRNDLQQIVKEIELALDRDFSYGWVTVRDPIPDEHAIKNTQPISWEGGAK